MTSPRLIINADDFGSGPGRNRGIVAAFERGLVTEASLLANAPAFAEATALAKGSGLPVGVHLNLSEGQALSGPIAGLTDAAGRFRGKAATRRAFAEGLPEPKGVHRELQAQVERILAAGLHPSHLDTHQHWGLFPELTPMLLGLAAEFSIPALRLPLPMEPAAADPPGTLGRELDLYRRLAPAMAATMAAGGLHTPQGLYGMPLLNRLDLPRLLALLERLPPGTWELMVHPGYLDRNDPFGGPAREIELAALTSPEAKAAIQRRGIQLITFAALPCAC